MSSELFALAGLGIGAGFGLQGSGWSAYYWIPGAVLIAAAALAGQAPGFLVLLIASTVLGVAGSIRSRLSGRLMIGIAASDLALAIAITIQHAANTSWALPSAGHWGHGSSIAAAAALLRLGSPLLAEDHTSGSMTALGFWGGALIAYRVGVSSSSMLVIGGICLVLAAWFLSDMRLHGLAVAGGFVAALAGISGQPATLLAAGLAGCAFALGESGVFMFATLAMPFSVAYASSIPSGGIWPLVALTMAIGLAGAVGRVLSLKAPIRRGRLAAAASIIFTAVVIRGQGVWLFAIYGAVVSGAAIWWLIKPTSTVAAGRFAMFPVSADRRIGFVAAGIVAAAMVIAIRLFFIGLHVGFL